MSKRALCSIICLMLLLFLSNVSSAQVRPSTFSVTPYFGGYLFDKDQRLVYRGQFDDSRPSNGVPVTGKDLRAALDAILSSKPVSSSQKPSIGCNIKWKPGNEPEYFG